MKDNHTILVVDDNDSSRYAITRYLQKAGFEVWEAKSGQEALELATKGPSLITLDVNLPDLLGYEVCRMLKSKPQTACIPVLGISAEFRSSTDKVRGLESGADGYLSGPVDPEELIANIRLLLRLRESQEQLRRSEAQFRQQAQLLDLAHDAIIVLDLDSRIQFWNRGAEGMYAWTQAEALGEISHNLMRTQFPVGTEKLHERVIREGEWHGELIHQSRDGRKIVVDSRWVLQRDEEGRPTSILEINRDISERKQAEETVRVSQQRLQTILDNTKAVVYIVDSGGLIVLVNQQFRELFHLPDMHGKTLWEVFPKEFADRFYANNQKVLAGAKPLEFEEPAPQDGTVRTYISIKAPLFDSNGKAYAVCGISSDITERKRAEDALRKTTADLQETQQRLREHAEQLESKVQARTSELAQANEQLKSEIAERNQIELARQKLLRQVVNAQEEERLRISRDLHDRTGQHLTALLLGLSNLEKSLPDMSKSRPLLGGLRKLADDMGQELHRIASELRPTALDDVGLRSTLKNYLQTWSKRYGVEADFQAACYTGQGVSREIEITLYRVAQEALTNVIKHARAKCVSVILERLNNQVHVIIEDDGGGFDADALFDASGEGQRLGLVGMKERLGFVGGTLSIESRPGAGTTVFARVPVKS